MSEADDSDSHLAIIGMAGRFPGAAGTAEFWDNLAAGRETIRDLTPEELHAWGEDPVTAGDPAYVPRHGVMDGAEWFDAPFFGYTPRDALMTDPQHRLFLECSWEAMEDSGYDPSGYPGVVGVYASASTNAYLAAIKSQPALFPALDYNQLWLANGPDFLATRTSYKLGLTGPSVTVLTACSSSLVAVHQAGQALLSRECDLALAGGASVFVPWSGYLYREGGVLSADGRCRAFDAAAGGTVGGDTVAVVALKRLADALADGDRIRSVVLATAVNNDGRDRAGFSAPSIAGQAEVIRSAHELAGVGAGTITYMEAHGTGTPLGDPVEIAALTRAFQPDAAGRRPGFCLIGSVKTNIGHADASAGVAGLVKVVLALQHGQLPPSLHFHQANPAIDFAASPFRVCTRLTDWKPDGPRRAGLSSFGMGGTNAHAVLEEAPQPPPAQPGHSHQLLVMSARTRTALTASVSRLADFLGGTGESLADVAFTLQTGRQPMEERQAIVAADVAGAVLALRSRADREPLADYPARPVVFMFPGQGAQHQGMTRGLYEQWPAFRQQVDESCAYLEPRLGTDLRSMLYPPDATDTGQAGWLDRTEFSQPALFVVEHALATAWRDLGVQPDAVIGHSLGELVAATVAGVLAKDAALDLVVERGRMMRGLAPGAMLAISLPQERVREVLTARLAIAAVNAPDRCVVSGPVHEVESLAQRLAAEGVQVRRLRTDRAFHSPMVAPIQGEFAAAAGRIELSRPRIPCGSTVTGGWLTSSDAADPGYWVRQICETVRFADGLATVLTLPDAIVLEIGPGRALSDSARRNQSFTARNLAVPSLPSGRKGTSGPGDVHAMLTAIGELWEAGLPIRWPALHRGYQRRRVPLPTYPFERKPYLVSPRPSPAVSSVAAVTDMEPARPGPKAAQPPSPAEPMDEIEAVVAALYSEVLGIPDLTADHDFFRLGGDSMSAAQLIARVQESFGNAVPLEVIFKAPVVRELASAIGELMPEADAAGSAGAADPAQGAARWA